MVFIEGEIVNLIGSRAGSPEMHYVGQSGSKCIKICLCLFSKC